MKLFTEQRIYVMILIIEQTAYFKVSAAIIVS